MKAATAAMKMAWRENRKCENKQWRQWRRLSAAIKLSRKHQRLLAAARQRQRMATAYVAKTASTLSIKHRNK
jgi:hypothetical protein